MANKSTEFGPLLQQDIEIFTKAGRLLLDQTAIEPIPPGYAHFTSGERSPYDSRYLLVNCLRQEGHTITISPGEGDSEYPYSWFEYSVPANQERYTREMEDLIYSHGRSFYLVETIMGGGFLLEGDSTKHARLALLPDVEANLQNFESAERQYLLKRGFLSGVVFKGVSLELHKKEMSLKDRVDRQITAQEATLYESRRAEVAPLGLEELHGMMADNVRAALHASE